MHPRGRGRWTWTLEQEEYLSRAYGNYSLETICKRLGKTRCSVHQKAKRLGLALYKGRSGMSGSEVAAALGVDRKNVTNWIVSGELKARRCTYGNHAYLSIEPEDFWKFAERHRRLINWTKYDGSIFPQPAWVADEIARCKVTPRHFGKVTEHDKLIVRSMRLRGASYKAIAAAIGRSEAATKHIFLRYTDEKYSNAAIICNSERTRRYGQNR